MELRWAESDSPMHDYVAQELLFKFILTTPSDIYSFTVLPIAELKRLYSVYIMSLPPLDVS